MIVEAKEENVLVLAQMAKEIWDNDNIDELKNEFIEIVKDKDAQVFIKLVNGSPVGFANMGLRYDYVEGTETSPVSYLEGIYVDENHRRRGYGRELVEYCEKWSKERGCKEFASDCLLKNKDSYKFHLALGFIETNRIICFKKNL